VRGDVWLAACLPAFNTHSPLLCLPCLLQVWAQMEEDLGFLQRAAELRSYNMQVGGWLGGFCSKALSYRRCKRAGTDPASAVLICAALHCSTDALSCPAPPALCCPALCFPACPALQERVEIVKPTNFSTNGTGASKAGLLAPIFSQISRWFQRYEEASGREGPGMPEFLPVAAERAVVKASAGRGSGGGGR
jgi:hypothetical protein